MHAAVHSASFDHLVAPANALIVVPSCSEAQRLGPPPRTTHLDTRLLVTLACVTLLASTTFTVMIFILETPKTDVFRPALSEEESERDAHIRTAITVGFLTMVVVGLAAMAYSFNEAQRPFDYL
ncbi:hypothetical protein MRX96_008014 [Rhipicephalus microplus]